MFVELGALGAIAYGYNRWKYRDIYLMEKQIKKVLEDNKLGFYTVKEIKRSLPWGYSIIVNLNGKGFEKLKEIKDFIETKIGYETFIEQSKTNLTLGIIKIIVLPVDENTEFKPIKTNPWESYYGLDYTMNELVVNLNKFPHILVSGQTGCGKTELIRIILTNLINNFTDRDINLYFSDLSDMCDFSVFENCNQVKGYAKNIDESLKLFEYLSHMYSKRLEIFAKNGCKNIQEYNEKFFKKRMSYNYIVMDEMADYFPVSKLENDYETKVIAYNHLKNFARKFRKVGFFLCIGLQRPDTTVLDPNLRSCLCTKIGFSQNSDASSKTVCDTTALTNIENRKALLMYGNRQEWFKTLYIDDDVIRSYISSSIVKDRTKLEDYNKFIPKKIENTQEESLKEIELKSKKKSKKIAKISDIKTAIQENINDIKNKTPIKKDEDEKVIPYKVRLKR